MGEKLIRRHPHVFEGVAIEGGDLLGQWERIKREEREGAPESAKDGGKSVLGGVPKDLPALFAAERLQERAARVRMIPPRIELPIDVDDPEFLGELLFDLVGAAREQGFDAEAALREANERFVRHVARVEARARTDALRSGCNGGGGGMGAVAGGSVPGGWSRSNTPIPADAGDRFVPSMPIYGLSMPGAVEGARTR